jgi:hypothetical protein
MAQFYFSGVHSKKTVLQKTPSLDFSVTATLGRVNEASISVMLTSVTTNCISMPDVS